MNNYADRLGFGPGANAMMRLKRKDIEAFARALVRGERKRCIEIVEGLHDECLTTDFSAMARPKLRRARQLIKKGPKP